MESISETIRRIQSQENSAPHGPRIIPNHFNRFAEVEGSTLVYDFKRCLAFMEEKGMEHFGPQFRIHPEDHTLIYKLLVYIIRDQEAILHLQRSKNNPDSEQNLLRSMSNPDSPGNLLRSMSSPDSSGKLNKGILLTGPVGCGKTSLMKLLRYFQPSNETFLVKSCREISFEFIAKGFEVIHKYSSRAPDGSPPKSICFDDLGTEQNLKYYGNECNVMAEILLSRYDQFTAHGTLTHLTTNLSATEIETFYGNRVRSRMREMFNLMSFPSESKDKRK